MKIKVEIPDKYCYVPSQPSCQFLLNGAAGLNDFCTLFKKDLDICITIIPCPECLEARKEAKVEKNIA
jgi:hypothetical protein